MISIVERASIKRSSTLYSFKDPLSSAGAVADEPAEDLALREAISEVRFFILLARDLTCFASCSMLADDLLELAFCVPEVADTDCIIFCSGTLHSKVR